MHFLCLPRRAAALALTAGVLVHPHSVPDISHDVIPGPGAQLTLTVDRGADVTGPVLGQVTLTCAPAGGSDPDPVDACAALSTAGGDFTHLRPTRDERCPMLFDPVTVDAVGHWLLQPVAYTHTYPNRCIAEQQTGGVFDF